MIARLILMLTTVALLASLLSVLGLPPPMAAQDLAPTPVGQLRGREPLPTAEGMPNAPLPSPTPALADHPLIGVWLLTFADADRPAAKLVLREDGLVEAIDGEGNRGAGVWMASGQHRGVLAVAIHMAAFLGAWLPNAKGRVRLDCLTEQQVASLLRANLASSQSPKMVGHIRAALRAALNQAVRWRLIAHNPATAVAAPRIPRSEVQVLTAEEAGMVLVSAKGHRHEALWVVALSLGMRQGEVLGLRWRDVDFDADTLRVTHALTRVDGRLVLAEPKTEQSRRTLPLSHRVREALLAHRDRQVFAKAMAGEHWQEQDFVFASTIGTPLQPRNVLESWYKLLTQAGLPRRKFHVARHTAVSLLIADGVPLRVVMELLGHSQISTTADTYGHVFAESLRAAADAMDRALGTGS